MAIKIFWESRTRAVPITTLFLNSFEVKLHVWIKSNDPNTAHYYQQIAP